MKELLEFMVRALVDHPEAVIVTVVPGDQSTVLELKVAPGDEGKVIGKQGRTARSLRTILAHAGARSRKRIVLEIVD